MPEPAPVTTQIEYSSSMRSTLLFTGAPWFHRPRSLNTTLRGIFTRCEHASPPLSFES